MEKPKFKHLSEVLGMFFLFKIPKEIVYREKENLRITVRIIFSF